MSLTGQVSAKINGRVREYESRQCGKVPGASSKLTVSNNQANVESDQGSWHQRIGDEFSAIVGNVTNFVKGTVEFCGGVFSVSTEEKSEIAADPEALKAKTQQAHNDDKKEIDAARSGFNDNRNDSDFFSNLTEFLSIPDDLIKAIVPSIPEDTEDTTNTGKTENDNIFGNLVEDITKEVKKYTKAFTQISAKSILKQAETVLKEKKERLKKMQEQLEEIFDENVKERLMSNFPISLLSGPATESSKDKLKSTLDTDEIAKRASEIVTKQVQSK